LQVLVVIMVGISLYALGDATQFMALATSDDIPNIPQYFRRVLARFCTNCRANNEASTNPGKLFACQPIHNAASAQSCGHLHEAERVLDHRTDDCRSAPLRVCTHYGQ